jgi:predicted dehydrogenase
MNDHLRAIAVTPGPPHALIPSMPPLLRCEAGLKFAQRKVSTGERILRMLGCPARMQDQHVSTMKTKRTISRRQFLGTTAAAAAFTIVPRHVLGGRGHVPPSEKINIALVGAGGQGRTVIRGMFQQPDAQIIAVADPAEQWNLEPFYYKGLGGRKPVKAEIEKHHSQAKPDFRCAEYEDFRVMLEKEKAIDAIVCATPDHLHAYVSIAAMRAGKHVYCEKPLTHNVWEARKVAEVAKETGVATQMGNQGHSSDGIRQTCEWIWDGAIGTVREVHAWVGANRWNPALTGRPGEGLSMPGGLNWDLWIGPREPRPFHTAYAPVAWRDFWAFGNGALGDFGCHDLDAPFWALDLQHPRSIEAHAAGPMNRDISPHGALCYYQFGARGNQPPVKVTWYDGGLKPFKPEAFGEERLPGRGIMFLGDEGIVVAGGAGGRPYLLPDTKMQSYKRPEPTLVRSKGHYRDWLDAIKGGPPASSHFEYGAKLTELVLLGVAALRAGRKIDWSPATMKTNSAEADAFLKGEYRAGWEIS